MECEINYKDTGDIIFKQHPEDIHRVTDEFSKPKSSNLKATD
jgi:hypothetical protein